VVWTSHGEDEIEDGDGVVVVCVELICVPGIVCFVEILKLIVKTIYFQEVTV